MQNWKTCQFILQSPHCRCDHSLEIQQNCSEVGKLIMIFEAFSVFFGAAQNQCSSKFNSEVSEFSFEETPRWIFPIINTSHEIFYDINWLHESVEVAFAANNFHFSFFFLSYSLHVFVLKTSPKAIFYTCRFWVLCVAFNFKNPSLNCGEFT